jgi:superfamily II DNA helicase RecQ
LNIEVFGLSLSLAAPLSGNLVTVAEDEEGLTVSIGGVQRTETVFTPEAAGPGPDGAERAACTPPPDGEAELFRKLAALRKKLAAQRGAPPYVIFHDAALREMCRALPADLTALAAIKGVGKVRLDKYGMLFIEAVKAHTAGF